LSNDASVFRTPHTARRTGMIVSIVIVNWNGARWLPGCLDALGRQTRPADEIVVVDNGSTDGSRALVEARYPGVRLVPLGRNTGFAAGNNLGLARARGRAFLLLNPDTEVEDRAIGTLLGALEADPALGVVGPALRYPDGSPQESRRRAPGPLTPFLESTLIQQYWPTNRILDQYYVADRPGDRRQDVDWLTGACLLARRRAVERAGGLDESFFMYSEELEWCLRLRAAGWRIAYEPAATVVHHEGASSSQAVPRRHIDFNASKVLFYRRRYGRLFGETLRAFLLLTYVVQGAQEGAKWLLGHKRPLRRQRLAAYARVLRSGLRPRRRP
jgi:GT2 family glycosyltransferase